MPGFTLDAMDEFLGKKRFGFLNDVVDLFQVFRGECAFVPAEFEAFVKGAVIDGD